MNTNKNPTIAVTIHLHKMRKRKHRHPDCQMGTHLLLEILLEHFILAECIHTEKQGHGHHLTKEEAVRVEDDMGNSGSLRHYPPDARLCSALPNRRVI